MKKTTQIKRSSGIHCSRKQFLLAACGGGNNSANGGGQNLTGLRLAQNPQKLI